MRSKPRNFWQSSFAIFAATGLFLVMFLPLAGCGSGGPKMGKVTGKIVYTDGSIPQGGVAVIRLEPAPGTTAEIRKAASNEINKDGSYELFTVRPGDGAIYGEYKAVFTILESYRTGISLVDSKYTKAETSPFDCVIDSPSHEFDFEIEKSKAKRNK
jgi:hypothetical protein